MRSKPSTHPLPRSGLRMPASILSVVVFPPPLAPITPHTSPGRRASATLSTTTRCWYRFARPSTATRCPQASREPPRQLAAASPMNVAKSAEHVLCRFGAKRQYAGPNREAGSQLREREPDRRGTRVAHAIGVDEYAFRLDPKIGPDELRHVSVHLVRDDMVDYVDAGTESVSNGCPAIEQLGSADSHRREIVLELERAAGNEWSVRPAGGQCEARLPAEADLAEEVAGDARSEL